MTGPYLPPSEFLQSLIEDDAPLLGVDADANIGRVIELTRDEHPANRDWATLLLAQQEADRADIQQALLAAAEDENEYVRAEAILASETRKAIREGNHDGPDVGAPTRDPLIGRSDSELARLARDNPNRVLSSGD